MVSNKIRVPTLHLFGGQGRPLDCFHVIAQSFGPRILGITVFPDPGRMQQGRKSAHGVDLSSSCRFSSPFQREVAAYFYASALDVGLNKGGARQN